MCFRGAFWLGLGFATIFNAAALYAAFHYPDWMWMYFADAPTLKPLDLTYIFLFAYYVPFGLGYYFGLELRKMAWFLWFLSLVFCLAAEGWVVWRLFDRYSVVGTREQFYNGTALSLFSPENPIAFVMNGAVGLMAVYFILSVLLMRKKKTTSKLSLS